MNTINFTWRRIYASAAGWAIFAVFATVISFIGTTIMGGMDYENLGGMLAVGLISFALIIAGAIVSIILSKRINTSMMAKAVKNQQVIRDFQNGLYDDRIPEKMKTEEGRQRLLRYLSKGQATSVNGAVWMARKKKADKIALGGMFAIFGGIFSATTKVIDEATADLGHTIGGSIAGVTDGIANGTIFDSLKAEAPAAVDNTWKITQEKNKAVYMETQAKNTAMASPGSYNAQRQAELANQQRIKANNMWRQG